MNYHRRWAGRRAWRVRALLAALLALAAWGLRPWLGGWALLLPLLARGYPARREEARALGEIDRRVGLVYRTALETPATDPRRRRLAAAANRAARRAGLPRYPWVELLLAASLWAAAAFLPAPAPAARTAPSLAGGSKALKQDGGSKRTDQPGPKSDAPARQGGQESAEPAARPTSKPGGEAEKETAKDSGKVSPKAAGRGQKAGGDESAAQQPTEETTGSKRPGGSGGAAGREAEEATPPTAGKKPAAEGLRVEGRPATDAAGAAAGGKAAGPAATAASQPKVVSPPPEAKTNELPSPWAGGKPPAAVRHAAESYIRNNPLPPGAAEALRRYFDLEQ